MVREDQAVRDGRVEMLYLDCSCGIAGDMLVGALLDLGGEGARAALLAALDTLPVEGFSIRISRASKAGIDCCDFDVVLDALHDGRDHDMEFLHGRGHEGDREHGHGCEHGRGHEGDREHGRDRGHGDGCAGSHGHGHGHEGGHGHGHDHGHAHRSLDDILRILDASALSDRARSLAAKTFGILARAEAKAHGVALEDVHFHEVGAVDSIVDIAAAVLVDYLGIERVCVPVLAGGRGTIRCQHGVIPVPVPATVNVCAAHGLPLASRAIEGELVTPTGAALVAALEPRFELPGRYVVRRVGAGAGKRAYEVPSLVRALLIEEAPAPARGACGDRVAKIECDIDDATGEHLAYAAERLREAGALEVHWLPIFTKKGRPAYQLQVVCAPEAAAALEELVLRETTTIGLRRQLMERVVLPRSMERVDTAWGEISVKRVELPDGSSRVAPEYEEVAAAARRAGVSFAAVEQAARAACAAKEAASALQ